MKSPSDASMEGPFRAPERLALALPLISVVGLMLVVGAAATGQSAQVVALAAVVGFGLCALAPMAMLEIYFSRPVRAMLAHLRAARDGREAPGAIPPGVVGDLVAAARDIRALQASEGQLRAALGHWEQMAAAGDEAIRAFRLQCEELAEVHVQSESLLRRSAQDRFSEISEALKALKAAAPAAAAEGATERIEQMLVYLADALERRDGKGADEGVERVEQALAEIARLIGRETQSVRESVSAAALTVRNDIAATAADDKTAESRQAERLETLEGRVMAKLAGPGLAEAIRSEAEATRRSLEARIVALLDIKGTAEALAQEAFAQEAAALDARIAEHTQAQASRLDEIEGNVARKIAQGSEGENKALAALARTTEKLRNAIDRLDALSASAATVASMQNDDLKATLQALESAVGAQAEAIVARLDASAAAFEAQASEWTLAASVDAQTMAALRADMGAVKARVAEVAPRVVSATEALAQSLTDRWDAFDAATLHAAARDLADLQTRAERHAGQIAASAAAWAALDAREGRDFDHLASALAEFGPELSRQWDLSLHKHAGQVGEWLDALDREAFARPLADFGAALRRLAETTARLEGGRRIDEAA